MSGHGHSHGGTPCNGNHTVGAGVGGDQPIQQMIHVQEINIFSYAKEGDLEKVRELLESGEDVNVVDEDGSSPLHWAALFDQIKVMSYLLERGAEIDLANLKEGQTPLHWACIGKSTKAVMKLIHAGADPCKQDRRGYNSLIHAAQYDHILAIHFLLKHGHTKIQDIDKEGHTSLHWTAYQKHESAARLLLTLGADINATDDEGMTPLHWAALKGHADMVKVLLEAGADSFAKDQDGFTPEDLAQQKKKSFTQKLLSGSQDFTPASKKFHWNLW
eukprot:CAMPEP_0174250894 /NCGR_PEP_ID=MMETSP0439-20130205/911_1 /TAXON_ID=0 /ORGANISM="Stereomyxa ramosa, Strain Chinc5" /LENGTH=273 /DNA_ID=CAMNT_0015331075 /DNA_START=22 /DNA_END=840 /DNA_ORIENTATION=+